MVRDEVRDKLDVAFDDFGEQQVKNIARSVRVFRISPDTLTRLAPAIPALGTLSRNAGEGASAKRLVGEGLALPEKPTLAVLPFQNMSGDPEQEYFADGIVEEITTAISRFPWLSVIARNSSCRIGSQRVSSGRSSRSKLSVLGYLGRHEAEKSLRLLRELHPEPTIAGMVRDMAKGLSPERAAFLAEGLRRAALPEE